MTYPAADSRVTDAAKCASSVQKLTYPEIQTPFFPKSSRIRDSADISHSLQATDVSLSITSILPTLISWLSGKYLPLMAFYSLDLEQDFDHI